MGGEEVIKRASGLSNHPSCHIGLERLQDVYDILNAGGYRDYLLIDLGEVRGFDYYTGTIFEIFAAGVGAELGGGGRYDHLLEKFGAPSDSTGFALYIERIQEALACASVNVSCRPSVDFIVLHSPVRIKEAMLLTQTLRDRAKRVVRKSVDETACSSLSLEEARSQKIQKILVLEGMKLNAPPRLIDVPTGRERILNQRDTLGWLKSQ